MKILYKDFVKTPHLHEVNLTECEARHERNNNPYRPTYRIMCRGVDFITERLHKIADAMAGVLLDMKWNSGYLDACFDVNDNDREVEFYQTITFGGEIYLEQDERDAFWLAIKEALKRGDRLFDVEEWYANYKEESKTDG